MDLREQLQATLGSAYTLGRELGGGGMSRVFLAEETGLRRTVVVKVLTPELCAGISAERFRREVLVAASLQQANIVPLHAAGEAGGLPYYTMPLVEGESLRARLTKEGALPVATAISILRDVARALAYAHERGIVHRDIKPDNILLSGETAVVTDFGIAKALEASRTDADGPSLTQTGTTPGTPAYMAPEQAVGDDVNHRADIYSLGLVGWEMVAGRHPFAASATAQQMIGAQLSERPADLSRTRPDVPHALSALLARCLEKDASLRPQSVREVLAALDSVTTPSWSTGRPRGRRTYAVAGAVVAVLAVVAVGWLMAGRGGSARAKEAASLAVLPFANAGGDSAQNYLADGISDELSTALGKIPGVQVLSRTTANRYRGRRDLDTRDVGRTLGVAYVVQGTVRPVGSRLRISVQLARAATGVEVWAETFDRDAKDLFAVQNDIMKAIAAALAPRQAPPLQASAARPSQGTADLEAYDLYMRGEYLLRRRGAGVPLAAEQFERAIARDSTFARAHSGLSLALELFPFFVGGFGKDLGPRGAAAARRALALDPSLAEPHVALAMAHEYQLQWDSSRAEFEQAIAMDPSDASSRHQYGRLLLYLGNTKNALAEFEKAKELDPTSALYSAWRSGALGLLGRFDEANAEFRRSAELDSTNAVAYQLGGQVALMSGNAAEARARADRMPRRPPWLGVWAYTRAVTGDRATAQRTIQQLERMRPMPDFGFMSLAFAHLGLGESAEAFDAFERALDARETWLLFQPFQMPMFDPLRSDPRWRPMLRRAGLDGLGFDRLGGGRSP